MRKLFCFGLGFSGQELARRLMSQGWTIAGTCRTAGKREMLIDAGIDAVLFDGAGPSATLMDSLAGTTHVLVSAPPDAEGDPVLRHHSPDIVALGGTSAEWLGYLSTTGVYGNTDGAEVDETSPLNPTSARSQRRVEAERGWLQLGETSGIPTHVFRLAGIYGPGRSTMDQVKAGAARRIDKPGHRFSRIHVDDIASVLEASIANPRAGGIYNVCDDEPAAQADVVAEACKLLGVEAPPLTSFDDASKTMSPMGLSFWNDNRVVSNRLLHDELGVRLAYPTYREGLASLV